MDASAQRSQRLYSAIVEALFCGSHQLLSFNLHLPLVSCLLLLLISDSIPRHISGEIEPPRTSTDHCKMCIRPMATDGVHHDSLQGAVMNLATGYAQNCKLGERQRCVVYHWAGMLYHAYALYKVSPPTSAEVVWYMKRLLSTDCAGRLHLSILSRILSI